MNTIDPLDPRLVFYLENKDKIDEWIGLPKMEPREADRFFQSLERPMREAAEGLSGSPSLFTESLRGFSFLHLQREEWMSAVLDTPLVSIGLEWRPSKDGFREAWMGVRVNRKGDSGGQLHQALAERMRFVSSLAAFRDYGWYPVFQNVSPSTKEFWADLDGLANEIIQTIVLVWNSAWEVVDAVMKEHGGRAADG